MKMVRNIILSSFVSIVSFSIVPGCSRQELLDPKESLPIESKGIEITESGDSTLVAEGGSSDYYTIVLTDQPISMVLITVTPSEHISVNGSSESITVYFTAENWYLSQTVTVSAFEDVVVESTHAGTITHTVASLDDEYNSMDVRTVQCTVIDNDSPGVDIAETGGSTTITEGLHSDSYSVSLTYQPLSDVSITITPDISETVNGSSSPVVLAFTAGDCPAVGNWCVLQHVTVDSINNDIAEGTRTGIITHAVTAGPSEFFSLNPLNDVDVSIIDDETPGVTMGADYLAIAEGGTPGSYGVALTMQPTGDVTITVFPDAQVKVDGSSSPVKLDFIAGTCPAVGNWCVPQQVLVTAVDDAVAEGTHAATIQHKITGAPQEYQVLHSLTDVTVSISDND